MALKRACILLLVSIGLFNAGLAFATVMNSGVGWDAGIDTLAAQQVMEVTPGLELREAYDEVFLTSEFYGILIQSAGSALDQLLGGDGASPTGELRTFRLQGIVSVSLMILASIVVATAVGFALRSRLAAAFTWAAGLSIPLVMGLSAVDFKDAPLAAGMLTVSAGLSLGSSLPATRWATLIVAVAVGGGAFVALGVRIGSWPLLGILVLASLVVLIVWPALRRRRANAQVLLIGTGLGTATAIIGVYILNPFARIDYPRWVFDGYLTSRSYPWEGVIRMAGVDVASTALPWWYVPVWFLAQTPILLTLLMVAGVISWFALLRGRRTTPSIGDPLALSPFAVQAFVLPIGVVMVGSVLYDGIRHLMFAVAALPVFMACTMALLDTCLLGKRGAHSPAGWPIVGQFAAVMALVAALVSNITWFPYQYAHINLIAASAEGERPWELDYWGVSAIEGSRQLQEAGAKSIVVLPQMAYPGTPEIVGALGLSEVVSEGDSHVGVYTFRRFDETLPEDCDVVFSIVRASQILGHGGLCDFSDLKDFQD